MTYATFGPANLAHPYQLGRHGATRKPPAGLTAAGRRDWYRRFDDGTRSFDIFVDWERRTIEAGEEPHPLIMEWRAHRVTLGLAAPEPKAAPAVEPAFEPVVEPASAPVEFDWDNYADNVAATHGNAGGQTLRPAGGEWWEAHNLDADGTRI